MIRPWSCAIPDGAIVPGKRICGPERKSPPPQSTILEPLSGKEIATTVDAMIATGEPPALISIHSSLHSRLGLTSSRPWKIGVLWDRDGRIPETADRRARWDRGTRIFLADEVGDNEAL